MHSPVLRRRFILPLVIAGLASGEWVFAGGSDAKPTLPSMPSSGMRGVAAPSVAAPGVGAIGARTPLHDSTHVFFDEPGDGSIWARGNTYKASFGRDGAQVIPWLGAGAPVDRPVSLLPISLVRGGAAITFEHQVSATRSGESIAFDRGSFVERYSVGAMSLEQTFVFQHVSGSGDLVLRLEARTDLTRSERVEGLRFESELGGVSYGRATVIDARGRTQALETHGTADGIEIRVPSSFLDTAAFPVTIDPVISTFAIDTTTPDDFAPDVAYDAGTNRYMVCYEEAYSATDHDVYEELLDASGSLISGAYIDFTNSDWRHPRIANNASAAQYMVVAQVGAAPGRQIFSRIAGAQTNSLGFQIAVAPTFSDTDQVDPDIGGDPAPSGSTNYLVVWEFLTPSTGERDIVQMLMRNDGTPDGGTAVCIDCNAGARDFNPSVSKWSGLGNGHDHVWSVVWEYAFSSIDHDIYGAQLANAFQIAGPFAIDTSTLDDRRPSVSSFAEGTSAPGNYMVAFDRAFTTDHDIIGYVMNGASVVASNSLSFLEGPAFYYQDQIAPSVDSDGCAFAVAYSEQYQTSTTDYDVYVSTFNLSGGSIDPLETHQNLAFSSLPELDAQITSARGGPALRYMTAWTRQTTGNSDIYGGLYDSATLVPFCFASESGFPVCPCSNPSTGGGGCDNSHATGGATLTSAGVAALSADSLSFTQTGELPTSLSIVLQGNQHFFPAIFGGGLRCVGGSLKRLFSHAASGGTVSAPIGTDLAVSARSAALGDTIGACSSRFYQVYYRDPNLGFCAAGFNVGNGVKVLWLP